MSRLTDLIRKTKAENPKMGEDLEREFRALSSRLSFGLNFERHNPEAVELPNRQVRKGDKVRVLPPRGETKKGDQRLWRVKTIRKSKKEADLELPNTKEPMAKTVALDDLVVIAEFGDIIYPGLISTGKVSRGGEKPSHSVINGENYHVLKALTWTHRGKVDAIYIDPPYNSGAKDWKYNNDYVDGEDQYRHSKWLAMMERRLLVAKELLNPEDSVLIVTIDEKEYLRLGLLLEQVFEEASIQMITSIINSGGTGRANEFSRTNEFIFVVKIGKVTIRPQEVERKKKSPKLDWQTYRRRDLASKRGTSKGGPAQFYPIYVNKKTGMIEGFGEPLPHHVDRNSAPEREGCIAVFPVRPDGTEMNWGMVISSFKERLDKGYARAGKYTGDLQPYIIQYLKSGAIRDIEEGRALITKRNPDGSVEGEYVENKIKMPTTQWNEPSHNAEHYGTGIIKKLIPNRSFPFPKSLYAVEDVLRMFLSNKKDAIILDFFSGSGTTAHAVMRLNQRDSGKRQCISVTNNEVSAETQKSLQEKKLRQGDPDWEKLGICDYLTKPRVESAITGKTPEGEFIEGEYQFGKTVEKEKPRSFKQIGFGSSSMFDSVAKKKQLLALIDDLPQTLVTGPCYFIVREEYTSSVLFDTEYAEDWLKALDGQKNITNFYIVSPTKKEFEKLKMEVSELLGPRIVSEKEVTPMADGFEENADFFTLTYETPLAISYQIAFSRIAPLLWLRAGSMGKSIDKLPVDGWDVADAYGLLIDLDLTTDFLKAVRKANRLRIAYIVTDDERRFQSLTRRLPEGVEAIRLYESYLTNFAFANGDDA